jgi:hypothetical protein
MVCGRKKPIKNLTPARVANFFAKAGVAGGDAFVASALCSIRWVMYLDVNTYRPR